MLTLLCSIASAQVQLEGVRQGYALDEATKAIRPMIGSPGSAYLGPVVSLPFPLQSATVRGSVALVISTEKEPRAYVVHGLGQGSPQVTELARAQAAYLDDTGSMALLVDGGELRFATGLAAASGVTAGVPFDSGRVYSAVALLQDRNCAVVASKDGTSTLLYRFCADRPAEFALVRTLPGTGVDALAHSSQAGLFVMDRGANRLLLIRNPIEAGAMESLATAAEGIDNPVGLVAIGSEEALVAMGGSSKAVVLSGRTGEVPVWIDLPATPDRVESLLPNRLVSCTGMNDQPLLVIDLLQNRTPFFVPVLRGAE